MGSINFNSSTSGCELWAVCGYALQSLEVESEVMRRFTFLRNCFRHLSTLSFIQLSICLQQIIHAERPEPEQQRRSKAEQMPSTWRSWERTRCAKQEIHIFLCKEKRFNYKNSSQAAEICRWKVKTIHFMGHQTRNERFALLFFSFGGFWFFVLVRLSRFIVVSCCCRAISGWMVPVSRRCTHNNK